MTEAVQTLEPPAHRYKRGDVREDGLIFWQKDSRKVEVWLSEKKFLDRKTKKKLLGSKWRKENEKRILNQKSLYRKNNKEKIKESASIYYNNNKEKVKGNVSKYKQNNKEKVSQRKKEYFVRNRYNILSANKQYRQKNKCELSKKGVIYQNKRRKTDKLFALKTRVSCNIRQALGKKGYTKKSRTHEILGCSFEFFKNYIEQRFKEGMTWENRSEWHLDHIIPISSATTEKEILKFNHYSNFRPLWSKDNILKSNHQNKQLELINI